MKSPKPQIKQAIPTESTTAELAALVGVGESRIRQLVVEGVFVRSGRNRFDTRKALLDYFLFLRDRPDDDGGDAEFKFHRARLYKARADMGERENALANGTSFSAEAVKSVFVPMLHAFRSRALAIPSKVAPVLADCNTAHECFAVLETEIYEALTEMSGYDETAIAEGQRQIMGMDAPLQQAGDAAE